MHLNQKHFETLLECVAAIRATEDLPESVWIGRSSQSWLTSVRRGDHAALINVDPAKFSVTAYNRRELREKIAQQKRATSDAGLYDLAVDILAWGEMSIKNARYALPTWDAWKKPCAELIQGLDAVEAYDQFFRLQHTRAMRGIGPAYYTKLIYFLGKGDGLIMDQWTSRSMNLLFGPFIKINREWKSSDRGSVDSRSDKATYKKYLTGVATLSTHLSKALGAEISASTTEEFIFSISAKKKSKFLNDAQHKVVSAWRKYVTDCDAGSN